MLKLLQINSVINTGSTGRIVEQIGQYVISKGWDSYIAYGRKSNESTSKTIRIGNESDHVIHGIQSRLFDSHGLGSVNATKAFLTEIKKIKPDIIHLHNIHGYYINYRTLFNYLAETKIPIVWTLHDCWAFTGHCSHFSDINCIKWQTHCEKCPKTKNYPSSIFMDNSFKNFEIKKEVFNFLSSLRIVTVSNWLALMIKQSFLSSYPVSVIYNGVDLEEFSPLATSSNLDAKYKLLKRKVLLAVATSWSKNKGWEDYIALSKLLPKEFVIVLVGITKEQKKALPSQIIGIERTESIKELAALYSHAEILLNLSYQESFGMTTVEGFACGTPAIVYNATASPELVTSNTGIVVEPGSINGVLKAIDYISAYGKDFYIKNCRKLAIERYNKEDRNEDYFQLYNSLLTAQYPFLNENTVSLDIAGSQ